MNVIIISFVSFKTPLNEYDGITVLQFDIGGDLHCVAKISDTYLHTRDLEIELVITMELCWRRL
jgi:hypothetical protein